MCLFCRPASATITEKSQQMSRGWSRAGGDVQRHNRAATAAKHNLPHTHTHSLTRQAPDPSLPGTIRHPVNFLNLTSFVCSADVHRCDGDHLSSGVSVHLQLSRVASWTLPSDWLLLLPVGLRGDGPSWMRLMKLSFSG